jgi:hypothetical protein
MLGSLPLTTQPVKAEDRRPAVYNRTGLEKLQVLGQSPVSVNKALLKHSCTHLHGVCTALALR